jgi:ketosteroid isomerase-like protein
MSSGAEPEELTGEAEVWQFVQEFNAAFAANNSDAYFKYVDEQITVITPPNPYRVEGIHDDREEFAYSLRTNLSRVGLWQAMQPKIQIYGETAIVSFFVRGSFGPAEHRKTIYWRISDVLAKRGGRWRVVHIHASAIQRC